MTALTLKWRMQGFTLIELMLTVAIIGVLASIAIPSYQSYVENTRRTTAQGELLELAQWMERRYSNTYSYLDDGDDPDLPFSISPKSRDDDSTAFYQFVLEEVDENSFRLEAQAINAQENSDCGNLWVEEDGTRGATGGSVDECW